MIVAWLMIVMGIFLIGNSIWNLKHKSWEDGISLVEATILKAGNEEPLPKSKAGKIWDHIQLWMGLILGIALIGLCSLMLMNE